MLVYGMFLAKSLIKQNQDFLSAISVTSKNREEEYYEENVFVFIVSCFGGPASTLNHPNFSHHRLMEIFHA
jgi:hypothetical protein